MNVCEREGHASTFATENAATASKLLTRGLMGWFNGFTVVDNQLVQPTDYKQSGTTAPLYPRLPDRGGYRIEGLFNIAPSLFGRIDNLTTLARKFSSQRAMVALDLYKALKFERDFDLQHQLRPGRPVVAAARDPDSTFVPYQRGIHVLAQEDLLTYSVLPRARNTTRKRGRVHHDIELATSSLSTKWVLDQPTRNLR